MTITRVASQQTGTNANNATSISLAYPVNVTNGNLLIISSGKWNPTGTDAYVVGDISKSAGTATLGAFAQDKDDNFNWTGTEWIASVVYSAPVTGTGSCTIQIAGALAGSYLQIALEEIHSDMASTFSVEAKNANHATTGAPDSGNGASAGAAIFCGSAIIDTATDGMAITEDAAFTLIYEDEQGNTDISYSAIDRIVSSGTTDSASWTAPTTKPWTASLAVYKEVGGPAVNAEVSEFPKFIMRTALNTPLRGGF